MPIARVKPQSPPKVRLQKSTTCPEQELTSFTLPSGAVVRVNETVELEKPTSRETGLPSGDFMRVAKIVSLASTQKVVFRGHILIREKYILGKDSDGRTGRRNEVVMHLKVHEYDNRPPKVQGLVDISLRDIKGKRDVIFTTKPFPMLSWNESPSCYAQDKFASEVEREEFLFHVGPLVCRWCRIDTISPNDKIYGGQMRYLQESELWATSHDGNSVPKPNSVSPFSAPDSVPRAEPSGAAILEKRPTLSPSLESSDAPPSTQPSRMKEKIDPYTVFDMFCGAGGASRGAVDAGLLVIAGLDKSEVAMEAWQLNNTGALPFCIGAFEFFEKQLYKATGRIDILSISCPCQPYCPAQ